MAFIFDKIRYELNNVEIDRNRNVGIISTLKSCALFSSNNNFSNDMHNAGLRLNIMQKG